MDVKFIILNVFYPSSDAETHLNMLILELKGLQCLAQREC